MNGKDEQIAIVGAGLIGSLLSLYLVKRGYRVAVYERRADPGIQVPDGGRSINLALSNRGIKALEEVGIMDAVKPLAIPMHGRMMHDVRGKLTFQPYGQAGQFINSISREGLNKLLLDEAKRQGVDFYFEHRCARVDLDTTTLHLRGPQGDMIERQVGLIIGADGAFSAVRYAFQVSDRFNYSQYYIDYGYKELTIPAGGGSALEKNALHIWPRESFMMIALPNVDGSFTCTLFNPFDGNSSFAQMEREGVLSFFQREFPDAIPLMPALSDDYSENPTSSLVTVQCYPWVRNKTLLIGDAAHAIVPFFGQGMNAGFEDCRLLNALLDRHEDDWSLAMDEFQRNRKADADAIARLALDNFVEMRDHVADGAFLLRKKIEARLYERFPDQWIPLYSMVTFHEDIPYAKALSVGEKQKVIMDDVMQQADIAARWESLDYKRIVDRLH